MRPCANCISCMELPLLPKRARFLSEPPPNRLQISAQTAALTTMIRADGQVENKGKPRPKHLNSFYSKRERSRRIFVRSALIDHTAPLRTRLGAQLLMRRARRYHGLPYRARDGTQFLIEVAALYNQIESVLRGLLLRFALGLPLIVALAIGGGYLLMRGVLRPVDEIRQKAAQITSRNLSERLPLVHAGDELERLATPQPHGRAAGGVISADQSLLGPMRLTNCARL